jgi:hypothetical protein
LRQQDFLAKILAMARPRKYGDARMNTHLRIPVTDEQKELIGRATVDEKEGMAAWARAILLAAASRKLARQESKKNNRA